MPGIATREVYDGIWGSEIAYNTNTNMFVIYAAYDGISVFESAKPEGPYANVSGGIKLSGYAPGCFSDDDGNVYLVTSACKIALLSKDGKTSINPNVSAFNSGSFCEGPEVFKRAPYYYATWSQGGTQRGANGVIMSARSKSLSGPWEQDPANPITSNLNLGTDPAHPFEGPQHSEPLQSQNGEWFVTVHTWEYNYGTLARDMCLEPVTWTADNWWRTKNGPRPTLSATGSNLPVTPYTIARSDDFSSTALGLQWFFHTTPDWTGTSWSLSARPSFF